MTEELLRNFIKERRNRASMAHTKEARYNGSREADGIEAALIAHITNDNVMLDIEDSAFMEGWNFGNNVLMW